jgi:hypothetical protein
MKKLKKTINILIISKLLLKNKYYLIENNTKNKIYTKTISKNFNLLKNNEIDNLKFPTSIKFFNDYNLLENALKAADTNFVLAKKENYYFLEKKLLCDSFDAMSIFFQLKKISSIEYLCSLLKQT